MSNVERRELAMTNPHKPLDPWWTRKRDLDWRGAMSEQPMHVCKPHEVVPEGLRTYLRWDHRHDQRDRELIRQLAFMWGREKP
jgi:hypothetical protein